MLQAFTNATIFTGTTIETGKAILVDNHQVVDLVPYNGLPADCEKIDLQGLNIAPAFIDLQIYGGNGKMFSHDLSIASLQATYEYCLQGGASHFMITMATNSIEKFLQGIEVVKEYWKSGGKGLLGLHLEGPYLNSGKRGAHIEHYIKKPAKEEVQMLLEKGKGVIKMITIAPEICDDEIIELFLKNILLVSVGHTNAKYEEANHAFNMGIPAATHLFNAMSSFQHRAPGTVGAIFNHPMVLSSLVCDGVHVDFAAVIVAKKIMQTRLFYITDAVAETLEGEYKHIFKGDRYTLPDGTLSGSSLTMMAAVKNGVLHAGIPLDESLRMASAYPAKLIEKEFKLGKIEKGSAAHFVIFDKEFNVKKVVTF
jgi:N-acetylglucosamine-6-phosphate deacetylase